MIIAARTPYIIYIIYANINKKIIDIELYIFLNSYINIIVFLVGNIYIVVGIK